MNKSHAFAAVSTVYFEMKYSVQSSTDSSQTGDNISNMLHDMNVVISDNKYIGSRICPMTNSSVADDLE